jgi:hypothetical protein
MTKILFGIPKKEDVERAADFLIKSARRTESELVLWDEDFLKNLADIIEILEEKNAN